MKIYEITGKIRENPQPPGMQQAKVVKQTGNELTVAPQAQGQPTGTEVTVDLSKNPQAIQKDPQGNVTVNPNAAPSPTGGMQLQPGQDINIAGAPGAMLPNQKPGQPQQQDQQAAEEIGDEPKAGITIGGLSRRTDKAGNTTDRYQAGPMDVSMTKNAQGQPVHSGGTYRVNKNASISVDTPFNNGQKGITKMVGQAADPDDIAHLMGTDASAQRMGVDPKALAKFQQGMPKEDYLPTGYNDKYREKAMMRKAFQNVTQDKPYFEGNDIVALAKRVSNVPDKAASNQKRDIVDLKKLAGL